jgi:hypothetical protein
MGLIFDIISGNVKIEAISKKSFRPISALSHRLKYSTYLSMRVEDPVNRRGGLILGLVLISTENPNFEIASKNQFKNILSFRVLKYAKK